MSNFDPSAPLPPPEARTDAKAIWSLICGILSVTCLWIIAGIPAIVLGHVSRASIRNSMGRLKGDGMALVGLILGWISVAALPVILIIATIAIPSLLRSRQAANEAAAIANLRTIIAAESNHLLATGNYGTIRELIDARLIDGSFNRTKVGYEFSIELDDKDYTASATPSTPNTGRWAFSATSDGVIRYSLNPELAPAGQAGLPAQ